MMYLSFAVILVALFATPALAVNSSPLNLLRAMVYAQSLGDANLYRPIYKFDGSSSSYCYPDYPSSKNDGRCITHLNQKAPVYVQVNKCSGYTVYTYWLWYGKQKPCIAVFDKGHGNDWERVSVYVKQSSVKKVLFHQHGGHYTRVRGSFEIVGERPVVYIGKVAHGSYHSGCDGKCSFYEFIMYGCYGSLNFCPGGCGYWDDYRNPGPTLTDAQVKPLRKGEKVDGIVRPDRTICLPACEGSSSRKLTTSGCWQNSG